MKLNHPPCLLMSSPTNKLVYCLYRIHGHYLIRNYHLVGELLMTLPFSLVIELSSIQP